MGYRILYKPIICLLLFLSVAGCAKELADDLVPAEEDGFVRILFTSSAFTKVDTDLRVPTVGNEDGIQSLDLYGIAWGKNSSGSMAIINIFHAPGKNPLGEYETEDWGVVKGDTILVKSNLFSLNDRGEKVEYVNLYAIANIGRLQPAYPEVFNSFDAYNSQIVKNVKDYLTGRPRVPIPYSTEELLKDLVVTVDGLSAPLEYPVMIQSMNVEGGAFYMQMPLERVYCRIGFSFLFTGNSTDKIKINTITIDRTSHQGYLFQEKNEPDTPPTESLVWSAEKESGSGAFKNAGGIAYTNGEQPIGGTMLALYANKDSDAPLYFRSCQYLCDNEENAPSITLDITATSGDKVITRKLTAPLYNSGGANSKKHYGFLRNHSYQVISTISTSTLQLEGVTVEAHDWSELPLVDFPDFK